MRTRVLPVPGPATTSCGSIEAVTAAHWSELRSGQAAEVSMGIGATGRVIPNARFRYTFLLHYVHVGTTG